MPIEPSYSKYHQWSEKLDELDYCPWPGPRQLDARDIDRNLFIGRELDTEDFVSRVLSNRLVVLSGDSGVGKSSLLNVRLVAELTAAGCVPIVCRRWPTFNVDVSKIEADEFLRVVLNSRFDS